MDSLHDTKRNVQYVLIDQCNVDNTVFPISFGLADFCEISSNLFIFLSILR